MVQWKRAGNRASVWIGGWSQQQNLTAENHWRSSSCLLDAGKLALMLHVFQMGTKFQVQLFHNGLKSLCYEWWSVCRHATSHAKDCCSQELQTTVRWTFNSWVSLDRTGEPEHWSCRNTPPCLSTFCVLSLWPIGHQIPSRKCLNDNIPGRNVVGELSQQQPFIHVPWQFYVLSTADIRLHISCVGTFELYTSSAGLTFQRMAPGIDRCMK